ncbi:beta-ketoacyl synthase N-terminal-like domain-containing protein [Micromonospora sp. CPCC 205539]|uniref:beta-ketoacyl synthase N-terminal-like domain-containing protein n=1 Tax=Micromonospora sp. CPCC 205539 TaxID=3122408 RepID=UPI002FF2A751
MNPSDGVLGALARHARERPEQIAYRFLANGDVDGPTVEWTYGRLFDEVRAVAATLGERLPVGARCLLLYPPGLDFVAGFLGCLWAGLVAVPAYLPETERQRPRALRRMLGVLRDCRAAAVLTAPAETAFAVTARDLDPAFAELTWLHGAEASAGRMSAAVDAEIAFLQYTSGSTGVPKGVVVSHDNLTQNLRDQYAVWQHDEAQMVSWLPAYHDMGLVGGLLYPLFVGGTATLLPPAAFIERPVRWLSALSRFGGTMSLAPNFGYQMCARRVSAEDIAGLDLSSWRLAGNGAEPVRAGTLRRFVDTFAPAGFDPRALTPCYGLAEATLFVTSTQPGDWLATDTTSCGRPAPGTQVLVVDPDKAVPVPEGELGEIWIRGPGNAVGYWERSRETTETFRARLADGDGPYLRTGDLGVLDTAGLHIRGRRKDVIIIDGVNHYPQDIEQTVEESHPAVRPGCVAAVGVDIDGQERVVVVAETAEHTPSAVTAIQAAVTREHQIVVHEVVLVRPRTIPKTSSGKIQRRATATSYGAETLQRHAPAPVAVPAASAGEVRARLVEHLAAVLEVAPREVRTTEPFGDLGLVSRDVVALAAELSTWLGRPVAPADVYGHPTVDALVGLLSGGDDAGAGPYGASAVVVSADAVAVVGIGCRFPGADGPAEYWSLLRDGLETVGDVPASRWDVDEYYQSGGAAPGRTYTRRGGFLDHDVAAFDATFFGLSGTEARYLDPQQRLLLEMAWSAMEDAGVPSADLAGTATGVYVGLTTSDYAQLMAASGINAGPYAATGNVACMAANRVSYTFDLRGPSLTIDTACSSSLVAIHQACAAIRAGEIDAALAGGVNLMLSPLTTVALCQSGALSADGHCYTFDARANGYVRGEGAGLVLLKPLSRALADGDRVYAVIRGSAVNQDGRSNGLTAPNPQAHARVIRQAHRNAGLDPGLVRYVEAHGTGTALGDPIEAGAVGMALEGLLPEGERCAIGSVKTNIGHLESAAGVAGLIKVALALYHGQIPASLHHDVTNPHIDLDALRLRVPDALEPWPPTGAPRVGGVNNFGVGGTNAHVVLQEAPAPAQPHDDSAPQLLMLTGRTPAAVTELARRFASHLSTTDASLASICHTAGVRRTQHGHRLAVVASSTSEMAGRLALGPASGATGVAPAGADPRVVFVFPGQGAQHVGMARTLYTHDNAFRVAFDDCAAHLRPHLDWSPQAQLHADAPEARLDEEEVVQPLLFAIQVALAATWRARGVRPDAIVGHSMGEVAAAYAAGVLNLADAAELTCVRAKLLATVRGEGAMAVVGLHHAAVRAELAAYDGRLHLAAANGPMLSVVSGDSDAVAEFRAATEARGVFARAVRTSGAGHSPVVDRVAAAVAARFAELRPKPAEITLYSSVTGEPVTGEEMTGDYWGRNLRDTVLFHPAVERLAADGHRLFLELSPNPTLVVPIQQAIDEFGKTGRAIGSLNRGRDDLEALLEAFGALYANGAAIDLQQVLPPRAPVATLPSGPWERRRQWFIDDDTDLTTSADVGRTVAEAFAGVLRVVDVPRDATFFELGGTSLMAAQMMYDLRSRLDRDIPLRMLFDHPTVAGLTAALESDHQAAPAFAPLARVDGPLFPLTFNQQRLVDDDPEESTLVIAQHLRLDGPVDVVALEAALRRLTDIHEGLRTTIVDDAQRLTELRGPVLTVLDSDEDALPDLLRRVEDEVASGSGPMFRFRLHRLDIERHVLSVVVHHLATDGWSQGILFADLHQAYEARLAGTTDDGLAAQPLRLVDFASWQQTQYAGPRLEQELTDWRARLADAPAPQLPFVGRAEGPLVPGMVTRVLDAGLAGTLERLASTTSTTMPMVILAALLVALHRAGGQPRLSVPMSASGRDRPELNRMVGFLSTSHLVTVDVAGLRTGRDALTAVRDALLVADEEQGISLSQYAHLDKVARNSLPYRVSMNYLPEVEPPRTLGPARVELLPRQSQFSLSRDIVLFARRESGALRLVLAYAVGVVAEDGIEQLAADLADALAGFAADVDASLPPLPRSES